MSSDCVRKFETLKYYKDLDGDVDAGSCSLNEMDLDQLRCLAASDEDAERDIEQAKSIGHVYYFIFLKTSVLEDLERAIDRAQEQIPADVNSPQFAQRLKDLIVIQVKKCQHTKSSDDLQEAIFRAQEMMAVTPPGHSDRSARMSDWINMMLMKFSHSKSQEDLDEAIISAREAGAVVSFDESDGGLKIGIPMHKQALLHDPKQAVKFPETTTAMAAHHMAEKELFDIEAAMASTLDGMGNDDLLSFAELYKDPTDDEQIELYIYTCFLISKRKRSTEHLEQALQRAESQEISLDATALTSSLGNQVARLLENYEQTGSLETLNKAIRIMEQVVDIVGEYITPDILSNLGVVLGRRFERTGSIEDLNRAIDITDIAVDATPQDYPNRANYLSNLGSILGIRFEQTGSIEDLNRAVDITDIAVDTTPQNHPDRAGRLSNLGNALSRRFERTGSIEGLNRAIDVTDMAIDATPQDHPNRARYLSNLGSWLSIRFEWTGSIEDLNRAVDVADMAVDITPQDHLDRALYLSSLGSWLSIRFKRTDSIEDLNRAIDVIDMAVDTTPQDHLDRASRLSNLGSTLGRRFEQTGSIEDLNRAIDVIKIAVDITPQDHPDRASHLGNLGSWLSTRFEQTGSIEDLNYAIDITNIAVDTTPKDHPDRAGRLSNLGSMLGTRFDWTGSIEDLNCALSWYKEGWRCYTAPPSIRIRLARQAAGILILQLNWEESSLLLQEAINLLSAVSPRSLEHTDKQHMLANFAGLASLAAATALNAGRGAYHALRLLELGRGVIAGLLIEMRGDISDLKQQHPGLADKFISLRDELDVPVDNTTSPIFTDNPPSWESQARRRREADQKFSELIMRIRALPGFHNFLLPPTPDELMAAANPDPIIVVNLSSYRCDAFLIERDGIRVLKLPGLTLEEVEKQAEDLRSSRQAASLNVTPMLEWLWDAVCRPSLEALGFKTPISGISLPRVWWISAGLLSQLPLHAAGRHALGSTETVLDRVMSSYASSIKALIYGRRHHVREPAGPMSDHALLVAMHKTPGLPTNGILPYAAAEVEMLNNLCPSLQLRPVKPTLRKDDVLQHLQACKIFHFAGHGQSNQKEPSQSCLLLEDWETNPLTVGDLRDHRLQDNPPFLSYLSACSTGANEADRLADEGIHLVSAFQLAGFRHVVGTLWEVSDKHCVDVAKVLYETIRDEGMTDVAVCRGLHRAVRALRDGQMEGGPEGRDATFLGPGTQAKGLKNHYWVPYVHFGV
ncbi:TPR domain-containing protein [Rutstroemia sp. NJR-2017a BBW]|nr:TPR domain-containing protein [Rutstroemia sp. NJR-2017a BBW]